MGLLRAEVRKLVTLRAAWILNAVGALLVAVVAYNVVASTPGADLLSAVTSTGQITVVALVVGLLLATTEFRYGTIGRSLLQTPSRLRVIATKLVVGGGYGLVLSVLAVAVATVAAALAGPAPNLDADVVTALWQSVVGFVATTVLGVAFGALVRGQALAIAVALIWTFAVENLVTAFEPTVAQWLPFRALDAVFAAGGAAAPPDAPTLEPATALAVFVAYVVTFTVAAAATLRYRDV